MESASSSLEKLPDRLAYSTYEACEVLSLSRTTLHRLRKARKLKPVHVGSKALYTREELIRFLRELAADS
jgi:excisionase family DNA binding protein